MSEANQAAMEVLQQAFSPSVAVIASPTVNNVCSKNRLTFVELLQPFSRLSVEGQIRDPSNSILNIPHLRLSIREIGWKPVSTPVAKRLLGQAVNTYGSLENKATVEKDSYNVTVSTQTPWFEAWRETLWSCMELSGQDFTRHYLACMLVVSSSEENPLEQFEVLNNQLQQNLVNGGSGGDSVKWFNQHVLRFYVLVHDSCEGDSTKAEDIFQKMRTAYGTQGCHYLVINSKPVQNGNTADSVFPAPDPWYRFLPKKLSKAELSEDEASVKGSFDGLETSLQDLPSMVLEGEGVHSQNLPFVGALSDAVKEISNAVLTASASTVALSEMNHTEKVHAKLPTEVEDPLMVGVRNESSSNHEDTLLGQKTDKPVQLEIHGACLTTDDVDRIQHLINEFCLRALLPHIERQIKLLHESAQARKSTHRSLLNATKRWFGTGKAVAASQGYGSNAAPSVSYHPESSQLQLRRLADLAFLVGHYELAFWAYHSVKKEFEADQAWLHFASALEMAGYSAFMSAGKRQVPYHYFEKALTTFLHTCKMPNYATRCAVLSSECFRASGMYNDAALQLIRLTGEDSDLRSALFLEQAALCFLRSAAKSSFSQDLASASTGPLLRKYALNMILAGHRFGKSGQRKHASRAYQQALQIYEGRQWSLAEDHIQYTVGRQYLSSQQTELASQALSHLFKVDSQQSAAQQAIFLKEFINVHQLLASQQGKNSIIPVFPLPVIDGNKIKVLVDVPEPISNLPADVTEASHVSFHDEDAHNNKWHVLEEKMVQTVQGSVPVTFRPTNVLFTESTNNSIHPVTCASELVTVEVPVHNPLQVPLHLANLRLLFTFKTADAETSSNSSLHDRSHENYVTTYTISGLVLEAVSTNRIVLYLRPLVSGELQIDGLAFELNGTNANTGAPCQTSGKVLFSVKGPRLNSTLSEKSGKFYGVDRRLNLLVLPTVPKLRVLLKKLPEFLLAGQVENVEIKVENTQSQVGMGNIYVAISDPVNAVLDLSRVPVPKPGPNDPSVYKWDIVDPTANLWIRGSDQVGLHTLNMLFYYGIPGKPNSYRLLRHSCKIFISPSVNLRGWSERIPLAKSLENNAEDSVACYVELKNQREAADSTVSKIRINQINLVGNSWCLEPWNNGTIENTIPREISAQESLVYTLRSLRSKNLDTSTNNSVSTKNRLFLGNSNHALPFLDLLSTKVDPVGSEPVNLKAAVHWEALQTAEDGARQNVINGLHVVDFAYLTTTLKEISQQALDFSDCIVNYSLDYQMKNLHNFAKQKVCIVPVILNLCNTAARRVVVNVLTNVDNGETSQKTQIYMPEPATPLKWVGVTERKVELEPKASQRVPLRVAVVRAGTYSLARGLEIRGSFAGEDPHDQPVLQNMRLEFTLFVESTENVGCT